MPPLPGTNGQWRTPRSARSRIPDITHPEYFHQLARTIDKVSAELPRAEHLRRRDDITPAIHSAISDLGYILAEISNELATSTRFDNTGPSAYTRAERSGTAALTRSAPALGTALGHLAQVVERLGFLHELPQDSRTRGAERRNLHLPGVQAWLQTYLDSTRSNLTTASRGLRKHAEQHPRTSTLSLAPPAAPHQTNPAPATDPKRRIP
ncbi:hypothetical protein ABZ746_28820 [Streptomyces sp. NPDC020096]